METLWWVSEQRVLLFFVATVINFCFARLCAKKEEIRRNQAYTSFEIFVLMSLLILYIVPAAFMVED